MNVRVTCRPLPADGENIMETKNTTDRAALETDKFAPALLDVPQTMARLNCAKSRLYELFLSGDLPRVKLGGRTMVPSGAVDRLLAELIARAEADAARRRAGGGR
jgi:predicted DNA-binding transcriptional regulator AlpA